MVADLSTYSAQLLNFVAQQVIQPRLVAPVTNVMVAAFMAFCSFSKWLSVDLLLQPEHEAVVVAGLNTHNMQIKLACLDWCHCVVKHTPRPSDEPLLVRLLGTIISYIQWLVSSFVRLFCAKRCNLVSHSCSVCQQPVSAAATNISCLKPAVALSVMLLSSSNRCWFAILKFLPYLLLACCIFLKRPASNSLPPQCHHGRWRSPANHHSQRYFETIF
jgi:hypothetical protein